jgi:F0F1-type ATP synthase gamma subunit
VVLAYSDEIDAERVCQNRFINDVSKNLTVRQQLPVRVDRYVAERVEAQLELAQFFPAGAAFNSPRRTFASATLGDSGLAASDSQILRA